MRARVEGIEAGGKYLDERAPLVAKAYHRGWWHAKEG